MNLFQQKLRDFVRRLDLPLGGFLQTIISFQYPVPVTTIRPPAKSQRDNDEHEQHFPN